MIKLEDGTTPKNSFKLDGLDYHRGLYEILYRGQEIDANGNLVMSKIKVGLRNKNTLEILQNPELPSLWINTSDIVYTTLSKLITDITSKVL